VNATIAHAVIAAARAVQLPRIIETPSISPAGGTSGGIYHGIGQNHCGGVAPSHRSR
jgi:hypothetical protein